MAHDGSLLHVHRVHERNHVSGKLFQRVTSDRSIRIAVATLVWNVNAILVVEQRQ